jgi:hypothetical protein
MFKLDKRVERQKGGELHAKLTAINLSLEEDASENECLWIMAFGRTVFFYQLVLRPESKVSVRVSSTAS